MTPRTHAFVLAVILTIGIVVGTETGGILGIALVLTGAVGIGMIAAQSKAVGR